VEAPPAGDPLWYKDAVVYQLHVRAFADSNGDGIGDFPGLIGKLDYLASLGVSCLWLLPFYPSPLRDDGYDIAHYQDVHPSYGTLKDFRAFLRAAHDRGLRVITELVINHTSDQHPWFQAARRAPAGSVKRDYYVWSPTQKRYEDARIIFSDSETSNWAWDPIAGAYYWHRFFHHQPDLNFDNPHVRKAVQKVMRFWLDMGVDGMRLDAVPYLIEREGTACENLPETHDVLRELRRDLDAHYADRMLLAEANGWPGDVRSYFGEGDECHMAFNFPLMPRMYLAMLQEDTHPIVEIIRQTPDLPASCQWAIFLRNHDELTLESVTDEERDSMYRSYAVEPRMRINAGIRRRLAPLLENSRERIQLANSLLLSLPGTPIVYYGDEIGMGDNIYLGDRNGVRTPMQWTSDRNAGFSSTDPARLFAPLVMDPVYGYQAINVEAQERMPASLLNWTKRMIAIRRQYRAFGRGAIQFVHSSNQHVLAYVRQFEGEILLCVANLSRHPQPSLLDLKGFEGRVPVELLGQTPFPRIDPAPYALSLGSNGFYWFRLREYTEPTAVVRPVPMSTPKSLDELGAPLLLGRVWTSAFESATRHILQRDYLPRHLATRRWFAAKSQSIRQVVIRDHATLAAGMEPVVLALLDVEFDDGAREVVFLPMAFMAAPASEELLHASPDLVVARISGARTGVLHERLDLGVVDRMLDCIARERQIEGRFGRFLGTPTTAFAASRGADATLTVERAPAEQVNTTFHLGRRLNLKLFRRVEPGPHPEVEIGRHLIERVRFDRVPPLAGTLEYEGSNGVTALAVLHGLVPDSVTGWTLALGEVDRYFERVVALPGEPSIEHLGWFAEALARLGLRTAEMHRALATAAGDANFTSCPVTPAHLQQIADRMKRRAVEVVGRETAILANAEALAAIPLEGLECTRIHGDYHLAQVLWHEGDFTIIDFEGDPDIPLADRRTLQSPLVDVAGMMRAFVYAAQVRLAAWREREPETARRLESWADFWSRAAAKVFLDSYRTTARTLAGHTSDPPGFDAVLRCLLIVRDLEDLAREVRERPAMAGIPLAALDTIIGGNWP
jgi:maltose alpha-D-glucosyltransferase / alpha-amylase